MSNLKRTIIEVCILGALSLVLAFGVNAARGKGHVKVTKEYFNKGAVDTPSHVQSGAKDPAPPAKVAVDQTAKPSPTVPPAVESKSAVSANAPGKDEPAARNPTSQKVFENTAKPATAEAAKPAAKHLDHPYQEMTADQVLELLKNPNTAKGLNVIIDARDDQHFQEGHLPGAIQSFPYEFDRFRASVMNHVNGAEKVVVYCGGGDCEDSIFMCRELVQAGVPEESIYLFAGGYEEWKSRKLPLESSSE